MELYILDNINFQVQSVCRPCNYNLNLDEETNGKSEFVLPSLNCAKKGYFIILNGLFKQFLFIIDDVLTAKDESKVTISALDISNIFNRKIIAKNEEKMTETGIETFLADTMDENFINSDDSILNLSYIDVYINSNTQAIVQTNADNGLYNFHTFLTNCKQYKNVYTEFSIENKRLRIDILYKSEGMMLVDTTLAEVTGYNKVYEVDPVTKVQAYIREDGSVYTLYLKSDRTTTTEKNDPDRLPGRIETISCDTLDNAIEEALNIIKANSFKHLVEFKIAKSSKLINVENLYIGRLIKIKTDDSIYDSYISSIELSDENFVSFKSGNLRIDFTDKQKLQERSGTVGGNKLDISGGNITGTLKVKGEKVLTVEDIEDKVNRTGDTMTGMLLINNLNQFDGVKKIRKIDEDNYSITVAIGADKAGKVQYQKNGTTINGIQLKEDGTIWNEKTNKRLLENTIIVDAAGENLNDYQNTGLYYFSNSPTNIPADSNGWLLVIAGYNVNTITKQIWFRHGTINSNDFEIYVRTYSGSWGNWNRLITEVESGSNSNGNYRKYSDGTMECWGTKTSTINISTSYEGSYFGGINGINFPASFISAPQVTCTLQQGSALLGVNLSGASASGFNVYVWKQQSKNNVSVTLNYRAIGKWK